MLIWQLFTASRQVLDAVTHPSRCRHNLARRLHFVGHNTSRPPAISGHGDRKFGAVHRKMAELSEPTLGAMLLRASFAVRLANPFESIHGEWPLRALSTSSARRADVRGLGTCCRPFAPHSERCALQWPCRRPETAFERISRTFALRREAGRAGSIAPSVPGPRSA